VKFDLDYGLFQSVISSDIAIHPSHTPLDGNLGILFLPPKKNVKKIVSIADNPTSLTPSTLKTKILTKTSTSYDGRGYVPCVGQPEYTVSEIVIPPFYELPKHTHPMPVLGVVLSGAIVLVNHETGKRRIYRVGAVIEELVETVHYGYTRDEPCTLLVLYIGVVGQPLMEPYNEGDKGVKALHKHSIPESTITSIINSCDIGEIVEAFKTCFAVLGGTLEEVVQEFAMVEELIRSDLAARLLKDPAVHDDEAFALKDIAFRALMLYRISHALWSPKYIQYTNSEARSARCYALDLHNFSKRYYIEIHPGASIGKGLYLDHGLGTRIGDRAVIGRDCGILDGVVIGNQLPILIGEQTSIGNHCTIESEVLCGAYIKPNPVVQEIERVRGRRHPVIGNNCFLCRGVKVLGPFTVADNSFVPIGTIVKHDYPKPHAES